MKIKLERVKEIIRESIDDVIGEGGALCHDEKGYFSDCDSDATYSMSKSGAKRAGIDKKYVGRGKVSKRGKKKDDSSGEEKVYRLSHDEESVNTVMSPYVLVDSKGYITAIDLYNTNAGIENAESLKTKGYDAYKTFVTISHEDWTFASDASVEVWTDDGIQEAERNSEIPNDRHVVSRIAVSDLIEFYLQHNKTLPNPK